MDIKDILKDSIKYSRYQKIETGIHDFRVARVELAETMKSKRPCINYFGEIKNSTGEYQESKIVEAIDNNENKKFGIARLIKFINYFKIATNEEIDNCTSLEQLIAIANRAIGKTIKIEFIKKAVGGCVIKEKVFIYE